MDIGETLLPVLIQCTAEIFSKDYNTCCVNYCGVCCNIYCGLRADDLVDLPVNGQFILNCEIATLSIFRDKGFITAQFGLLTLTRLVVPGYLHH